MPNKQSVPGDQLIKSVLQTDLEPVLSAEERLQKVIQKANRRHGIVEHSFYSGWLGFDHFFRVRGTGIQKY